MLSLEGYRPGLTIVPSECTSVALHQTREECKECKVEFHMDKDKCWGCIIERILEVGMGLSWIISKVLVIILR